MCPSFRSSPLNTNSIIVIKMERTGPWFTSLWAGSIGFLWPEYWRPLGGNGSTFASSGRGRFMFALLFLAAEGDWRQPCICRCGKNKVMVCTSVDLIFISCTPANCQVQVKGWDIVIRCTQVARGLAQCRLWSLSSLNVVSVHSDFDLWGSGWIENDVTP